MGVKHDCVSLLVRSAHNHLWYISPAAKSLPSLYAGKVESTSLQLMIDTFGVQPSGPQAKAIYRACSGFNLMWRAFDEVLDEVICSTSRPVTDMDLLHTPIYHKYAKRIITAYEGREVVITETKNVISGLDANSTKRRGMIYKFLYDYLCAVKNTANNPLYHKGSILTYEIALANKIDVTGTLGCIGAQLYATLLDIKETSAVEIFSKASVAMQLGDDLLDWRKDLNDYFAKSQSVDNLRPIENLLVATLAEHPDELKDALSVLTDTSKTSVEWLKIVAPKTFDDFCHRFQLLMDCLPQHPYRSTLVGIISYTFYNLLPKAPESGWFYNWAKY